MAGADGAALLTRPKVERNQTLRQHRRAGDSLRRIARQFDISLVNVQRILDETGGDPLLEALLASASEAQLRRRRDVIVERIGADLRRLIAIDEELEVRETDRLLSLG